MNMATIASVLLLVGGIVNAVPPLNAGLTGAFGGTPLPQIIIGAISIIVGFTLLLKKAVLS